MTTSTTMVASSSTHFMIFVESEKIKKNIIEVKQIFTETIFQTSICLCQLNKLNGGSFSVYK